VAGVSQVAEPALNDLGAAPGEEHLLAATQAEDRACSARLDLTTHYHAPQIQDFLRAVRAGRPPRERGEEGPVVLKTFAPLSHFQREGRPVRLPLAG
jgi:hypothetical protein